MIQKVVELQYHCHVLYHLGRCSLLSVSPLEQLLCSIQSVNTALYQADHERGIHVLLTRFLHTNHNSLCRTSTCLSVKDYTRNRTLSVRRSSHNTRDPFTCKTYTQDFRHTPRSSPRRRIVPRHRHIRFLSSRMCKFHPPNMSVPRLHQLQPQQMYTQRARRKYPTASSSFDAV